MSRLLEARDFFQKPKSWSSGRILTETQRQQKRKRDRIAKEKRRKEDTKDKEKLELQISALQQQLHYHAELLSLLSLQSGHCKCILTKQEAQCGECGLSLDCSLGDDQTYYTLKGYSDQVLGRIHYLTPSQVCLNEATSQDSLIRGILFGWGNLQNRGLLCPLLEIIHSLDTTIFLRGTVLTRLCMLKAIHSLLQCFMQTRNFRNIPAWYRPQYVTNLLQLSGFLLKNFIIRPSQIQFHHDISIDYFAWPGLRERLALTGSRILTDDFFSHFVSCFRFVWKREISDIYEIHAATGLYSFSSLFNESFRDIRNWTMDKEFYVAFPEVYCDLTLYM